MNLLNQVQRMTLSRLEWQGMALVTRVVMLAAIVANGLKAWDTLAEMSRPGAMDAWMLALALEGAFAIAAYYLSMNLTGRIRQGRGLLAMTVVVLAGISSVANVDYFMRYGDVRTAWGMTKAIIMGLAAPVIAVLTAILAGVVAGLTMRANEERRAEVEAERAHVLALAKQEASRARAEARQAKAMVQVRSGKAVDLPEGAGRLPETPEEMLEKLPEVIGWTGSQIGAYLGVSERTGRNWKAKMLDIRGNGHG